MSEIAELIELLYLAARRWTRIEARVRVWCHGPRAAEAAAARHGEPVDPSRPTSVQERIERVWYEDVDRWRCEGEDTGFLHIQNGRHTLRRDPEDPAASGSFEGVGWGDSWSHRHLWDPSSLIPDLWFETLEEETLSGRPALRVTAQRRETSHDFVLLPYGADGFELVVDVERGVLLRLASRFGGEEFATRDVLEVTFDQPFDAETLSVPDD